MAEVQWEKLLKTPLFTSAMIRLRFPDDTQIEANFASMEKIGDIFNLVKMALKNEEENFYLFQFPPAKKHVDLNRLICEEKLEPSTLLYVKFLKEDNNFSRDFFKEEFIEKYKCDYQE